MIDVEHPDIMDNPTFEQMVAEAVATIGENAVFSRFLPIVGKRHPLELNRAERTALMIEIGLLCREVRGGVGHA
jgi:translation elongation factor EF-Ts